MFLLIQGTSRYRWAIFFALLLLAGCKDNIIQPPPDENLISIDQFPAWSPDGKWIAYYHEDHENDTSYATGLYIIDTSGSNRRLLVTGYATTPDWSPDGRLLTFSNGGTVFVMKSNGDSIRALFGGRFQRWSPDGQSIVYTRPGTQDTVGIWVFDNESSIMHRVGYGAQPDWSPSGDRFVYAGGPSTGISEGQIWLMDTSGANQIQLTMNSFSANRYPQWSLDGKLIVWIALRGLKFEVWLMNTDGSNQHILTDGHYGSFAPDSRRLVLSKINVAKTRYVLWIINVDATTIRQLTH